MPNYKIEIQLQLPNGKQHQLPLWILAPSRHQAQEQGLQMQQQLQADLQNNGSDSPPKQAQTAPKSKARKATSSTKDTSPTQPGLVNKVIGAFKNRRY